MKEDWASIQIRIDANNGVFYWIIEGKKAQLEAFSLVHAIKWNHRNNLYRKIRENDK